MALNTSHTPDGRGVLIYNGEMILLYTSNVKMSFSNSHHQVLKGTKNGALYLTSHRILFMNDSSKDSMRSFAMPFHTVENVNLIQPLLTPNYLKGIARAIPGGNFEGEVQWKLSFPKGGCIEFGQALLRANDMVSRARPFAAPPVYTTTCNTYYMAPTTYYIPPPGGYQGFQAPTNVFPEQPPAGNVYMYDAPPPYAGIGQPVTPYPAGQMQVAGNLPNAPPGYQPVPTGPVGYGNPVPNGSGYGNPGPTGPVGYGNLPPYPGQQGGSQPPAYQQQHQQAPPLPEKQPL